MRGQAFLSDVGAKVKARSMDEAEQQRHKHDAAEFGTESRGETRLQQDAEEELFDDADFEHQPEEDEWHAEEQLFGGNVSCANVTKPSACQGLEDQEGNRDSEKTKKVAGRKPHWSELRNLVSEAS